MRHSIGKGLFQVYGRAWKNIGLNSNHRRLRWLFPFTGVLALSWYLIRVIPKPSRAAYPCQKVSAPVAAGFLTYVLGVLGLTLAYRNAKVYYRQRQFVLMGASVVAVLACGFWVMNHEAGTAQAFVSKEEPNKPMGAAFGIAPGRVAWVRNSKASKWDEKNGTWWGDANTDQSAVDEMVSKAVLCITLTKKEAAAWKALFKSYNEDHGKGAVGYRKDEKIAIKINLNNDRRSYDDTPWINTSPQSVNAVLRGLIKEAGVGEENITVYDATRYITPHFYSRVHDAFPKVKFVDGYGGLPGRIKTAWTSDRIAYALKTQCGTSVATCAVEASYLINIYVAKGHPSAGVTLSGKNHYGSINGREHAFINVKAKGYDQYNPLVELMGHKDLGGKTLLNVCDMLYGCYHSDTLPIKWNMEPFNSAWPSSLLVSQDPIANDSVALDFLTTEFDPRTDIPKGVNTGFKVDMKNCDAVLHEAALAGNPPSGTVYAPNGDGIRLKSLGVHEHWNNAVDKKYSRNLGIGNGVELVPIVLGN